MTDRKKLTENFAVAWYMLGKTVRLSPFYLPLLIFSALISSAGTLVLVFLQKWLVDGLMGEMEARRLLLSAAACVTATGGFRVLHSLIGLAVKRKRRLLITRLDGQVNEVIMHMEYGQLEDPETYRFRRRAVQPIKNQGVIDQLLDSMAGMLEAAGIFLNLGSVMLLVDIRVVFLLLPILILNGCFQKKTGDVEYLCENDMAVIDRRYEYYDRLTGDMELGKEVRLYGMAPYIMGKIRSDNNITLVKYFGKMYTLFGKYQGASGMLGCIQTVVTYAFWSMRVLSGAIGIGSYAMMLSATNSFMGALNGMVSNSISFGLACNYLKLYREFCDYGEKQRDVMASSEGAGSIFPLRLENVSFHYSNVNHNALQDISFTFQEGKRYAVVGKNGAGKSTLVKLLMGLYRPQSGQVAAGKEGEGSRSDQVSAIFQDFRLFAMSVKDNIIMDKPYEEERFKAAVQTAGLDKVLAKLPHGMDTLLEKGLEEEGVELSGGERQEAAMARMFYQDGLLFILDEPTSALDPFAEREVYRRVAGGSAGRSVIFISHRLSSCRMCDEILVMDEGRLIAHGTHERLLETCRLYRELWEAQAQYYVDEKG